MSWHGLIPEYAPLLTSVTPRETAGFSNAFGEFVYRAVRRVAQLAEGKRCEGASPADRPEISPLATRIDRDLTRQGYHVTTSLRSKVPVQVIWVRVERLLYEVGTAGNPRKKLSVRVEIDANALRSDIEPLLEEGDETQLLDPGRIRAMLAEG